MKTAMKLLIAISIIGFACKDRNRVGPQGSDGNGGIIDSTSKYNNTAATLRDSTSSAGDSAVGRDTTSKRPRP